MTVKKKGKDTVAETVKEEVAEAAPSFYLVETTLFQQALNVLAELPYNKVGNLLNQLRMSKEA